MKLVNIADLKSAASQLAGSSPVPGTRNCARNDYPDALHFVACVNQLTRERFSRRRGFFVSARPFVRYQIPLSKARLILRVQPKNPSQTIASKKKEKVLAPRKIRVTPLSSQPLLRPLYVLAALVKRKDSGDGGRLQGGVSRARLLNKYPERKHGRACAIQRAGIHVFWLFTHVR